jgi:hypothetical protein
MKRSEEKKSTHNRAAGRSTADTRKGLRSSVSHCPMSQSRWKANRSGAWLRPRHVQSSMYTQTPRRILHLHANATSHLASTCKRHVKSCIYMQTPRQILHLHANATSHLASTRKRHEFSPRAKQGMSRSDRDTGGKKVGRTCCTNADKRLRTFFNDANLSSRSVRNPSTGSRANDRHWYSSAIWWAMYLWLVQCATSFKICRDCSFVTQNPETMRIQNVQGHGNDRM